MELLVITIFLTVTGAQQSQLNGPENTLSLVGSDVTLKCSSSSRNCNGIDWQKFVPGSSSMTIFKGRTMLNVVDRARYSVDNSSGCDLNIRNVQLRDAGRYICSAILSSSQVTKTAYLIILDGYPKCTTDALKDITVEGERRQLTCEVKYNGTDGISLVWEGVTDAPAPVYNGNTISRSYSVVASAPEVPSYNCVTSFALAAHVNSVPIDGLATNDIPTANCSTSVIRVLYPVRNVTLSPSLSKYPPGTIITCVAMGYPLPSLTWQEIDSCGTWMDIQNQSGSQFTLTNASSKRFRCVAVNVVRGITHNATSREIQFSNTEFNDDLSSTRPTCTCNILEDRLVIGGIGIGIGVLATILLATVTISILFRLRYLEFHRRPTNKSPDMDQPISPSFRQLLSMDQSTPSTEARLVGEPEQAYASLGEERDINKYQSLDEI